MRLFLNLEKFVKTKRKKEKEVMQAIQPGVNNGVADGSPAEVGWSYWVLHLFKIFKEIFFACFT